jgi:large subunit ribosomal protein L24
MKIKTGDTVVIVSGSRKDKQKKGKVLKTIKETNQVVVEGINIKNKTTRDSQGKKTRVEVEFPINASNVMVFDEKAKKASRIGYTTGKDGKKVRITRTSGTELK